MTNASVNVDFRMDKCHFGNSFFQDPKKADDGEIQIGITSKLQK